jgi:peptidyl-prolyl cis-trans isomerase SurA
MNARRFLTAAIVLVPLVCGGAPRVARATERIAAVVNKEAILASDVDEQTKDAAQRMNIDPADTSSYKRLRGEVLSQLIEKQVLLAEATRQGITVTDGEVTQAVDREILGLKQRIGSESDYQAALARERTTEAELRKRYTPGVKEQLLISRLVGKEVQSKTTVTDAEVRTYYEAHRDSIGKKPEELRMAHILVAFEPDTMQLRRAHVRADSLRDLIVRKKVPFEQVAQQFSDDPSARVGGDLGTFGHGDMVAEFEDMAFKLKPMEISMPVRTRFGYHIIQVLEHFAKTDSTEERVHARHVMVQAKPTPADEERARLRALALRDSIITKGADFAAVAKKFSADTATRDSGGVLGAVAVPALPQNLREPLSGLAVGEVSVPFKREAGFHIFKVLGRTPESDYKYDDIKDDLRQVVLNKKLEESYRRWYDRVRKTVNVEVKN